MAKIKLCAEPTFKAIVQIPIPGDGKKPVEFTFKHRTRKQAAEWAEEIREKEDVFVVHGCTVGWELDDEFSADNIAVLCDNYAGAGYAIVTAYFEELRGERAKN